MADSQRKTANLVDQNVFATTYTNYVTSANGIITFNSVTSTMSSEGVTVDIPANTVFTCIPLEVTNGILSFRIRFEGETEQDRQMVYLYDSNGEPNTIAPVTLSFAVKKITIFWSNASGGKTAAFKNFMVNAGSTPLPYEPYGWVHSLRKLCSATEAVENPLYSDGTAITAYTLKGNTVQSGTPTPSNTIAVEGVGNKTANLLPTNITWYLNNNASAMDKSDVSDIRIKTDIFPVSDTNAYLTVGGFNLPNIDGLYLAAIRFYGDDLTTPLTTSGSGNTRAIPTGAKWASLLYGTNSTTFDTSTIKSQMQVAQITAIYGQTAPLSYIPYGYEIPISNGQASAVNYLGSVTSNREIQKLVLTGEETVAGSAVTGGWIITNLSDSINNTAGVQTAYCSHYEAKENGAMSGLSNGEMCISTQYNNRINFVTSFSSATDFQAYLAQQYAAGTPVTVWYVLATPTTGIVNEPLMKIGTYADSISNAVAIPTTEGANTITVDTTVQPSEFTATWTGWHDAAVKEKSENLWNEDYTGISGTMKYNAIYVGDGEFTLSSNMVNNNYSYIFFLAGRPQSGASTGTNDVYDGQSRTVTAVNGYVTIAFRSTASFSPESYNTMLNSGSTAQTYEPYWK